MTRSPETRTAAAGPPFANKQVPQARPDPLVQKLVAATPLPDISNLLSNNYYASGPFPPLPPKASTLARSGQMAPYLHLHPVSNKREAPTRMTYCEVLHPTTQNWINLVDYSSHGLRTRRSKDFFELAE